MAGLKSIEIPPPYAGLYTAAGPGSNPAGTAPVFRNFLPDSPAKAAVRGPIRLLSKVLEAGEAGTGWSVPQFIVGAVQADSELFCGLMKKGSAPSGLITNQTLPWKAPFEKRKNNVSLAQGQETVLGIPVELPIAKYGTKNKSSSVEGITPSMRGERLGKRTFFLAFNRLPMTGSPPPGARFINGGWQSTREIAFVYESSASKGLPQNIFGAQYLKAHLNRLWAFGGTEPGRPATWDFPAASGTTEQGTRGFVSVEHVGTETKMWTANPTIIANIEAGDEVTNALEPITLLAGGKITTAGTFKGLNALGEASYWVWINKEVSTGVEFRGPIRFKRTTEFGPIKQNSLWYSAAEGPTINNEKNGEKYWNTISSTSGLSIANQIQVGNEDENDYLVGGAVVNRTLLIFKRSSIWLLSGTSPSTFSLQQLSGERGCIDPWSICEAGGGCYFLGQNGFEFFDGSEFHSIDNSVANTARTTALSIALNYGVSKVEIVPFNNEYLMINMIKVNAETFEPEPGFHATYLYHTATGSWSEFTSNALNTGVVYACGNLNSIPWIHDGKATFRADWVTSPDLAPESGAHLDEVEGGGSTVIPAMFETDRIDISGDGGYTSQLHRFMMDYRAPVAGQTDGLAETEPAVWNVNVLDDSNKSIVPSELPYQLKGQGQWPSNTNFIFGRRFEADTFTEAVAGIRLKVEITALAPTAGEIYGTQIEAQTARQRRKI